MTIQLNMFPSGISVGTTIILEVGRDNEREIIGEVDYNSGLWMVHPGAIYIHNGETYLVESLDLNKNIASLSAVSTDYITEATQSVEVEIVQETCERECSNFLLKQGEIIVHSHVKGYKRIKWPTREVLDFTDLELPETILRTIGYWVVIKDECLQVMRDSGNWYGDKNDYGPNWNTIRNKVRQRDAYACQVCGLHETISEHHVHHKIPFKLFSSSEKANEIKQFDHLMPKLS